MKCARLAWALACVGAAVKLRVDTQAEHPIKRVIRLVQELADKSVQEGRQEELTYTKYVAWCETSSKSLNKAIEGEKSLVEKTTDEIDAKTMEKKTLTESVEGLAKEISELEASAADAAAEREKHVAGHMKAVQDMKATVEALGTAVSSLQAAQVDQDTSLQQTASKLLQQPLLLAHLSAEQEAELSAAAQAAPEASKYDFKTGGVTDLLKKLKMDFEDKLHESEKEEMKATSEYELEKGGRDNALKVARESKGKQESVKAQEEAALSAKASALSAAQADLEADSKSLKDTSSSCSTKAAEFKERVYMRGREQEAMAYGMQILQKAAGVRTAAPASFFQMRSDWDQAGASHDKARRAVELLEQEVQRSGLGDLKRLLMQVKSQLEGDGDVSKEVDLVLEKQIWKLKEEQKKEDEKWHWCELETDKNTYEKTTKADDMQKLGDEIESAKGSVATLDGDVKAATARLAELQKSNHELKMDRQESKNEHQLAVKDAQLAQEAISSAIGTLAKFYEEAANAALLQKAPTEVAEAPETWSKPSFSGTGQGKGPGEAIIKVLEDCSADFAQMEAETKAQDAAEEAAFETSLKDAKKEQARVGTEKTSKEEEQAHLSEKIRDMSEKRKMTDRAVSLLSKYSEDLASQCNKTAYEAGTKERKVSLAELEKSKAMLKDALASSTQLLRTRRAVAARPRLARKPKYLRPRREEAASPAKEDSKSAPPYSAFLD